MGERKMVALPIDYWLKLKILAALENTSLTQLLARLIDEHAEEYSERFNIDVEALVENAKRAANNGKIPPLFSKFSKEGNRNENTRKEVSK